MSPILFPVPVYQSYIWGGGRFASEFGRTGTPDVCAESWEVTAESGVPLLIKLIDACDTLSVQVHPNEETRKVAGGDPKTEAWHVLATVPGAALYAGLKEGVTEETLRAALADGTADKLMHKFDVQAGDTIFIPGGLVHAIGAGCLIYEVQQSSNTTYRLYDWNRKDASGKGRELHIEQAFACIDWTLQPQIVRKAEGELVKCPFFSLTRTVCEAPMSLKAEQARAVFVAEGNGTVVADGVETVVRKGTSFVVPTGCAAEFRPQGRAALLIAAA